jgi:hypothetical protein
VTLVGVREKVGRGYPSGAVVLLVNTRFTVPENPFRLVTVTVTEPDVPSATTGLWFEVVSWKSPKLNVTSLAYDTEPDAPLTVTE